MEKPVKYGKKFAQAPFREPKLEAIRKSIVESGSVEQIKRDWE